MNHKSKTHKLESPPLLAFGAHPDDMEFGIGALVAKEVRAGRPAHFVVVSRGESASNGTPQQRVREARAAAEILGATVEFLPLDGDGRLQATSANAMKLAAVIRKHRPAILLAPTTVENQHPDHVALGKLARDAARLARYGGVKELRRLPAHTIGALFFYAITPDACPADRQPVLVDVSDKGIMEAWTAAMAAHRSQMKTRNYLELQLTRARLNGLRAGVQYAIELFPNDPLIFDGLAAIERTARTF